MSSSCDRSPFFKIETVGINITGMAQCDRFKFKTMLNSQQVEATLSHAENRKKLFQQNP